MWCGANVKKAGEIENEMKALSEQKCSGSVFFLLMINCL